MNCMSAFGKNSFMCQMPMGRQRIITDSLFILFAADIFLHMTLDAILLLKHGSNCSADN